MSIVDSLNGTAFIQHRDLANAILAGDRFDTLAVRLRHAFDQDQDGSTSDYDGTDEDAVWTVLDSGLYADERARLAQVYRQRYEGQPLVAEIRAEFSDNVFDGPELEKTLKLLEHGGLSVAERVYYAVTGWGTDEDDIRRAVRELRQMTLAQIQEADEEYGRLASSIPLYNDDGAYVGSRPATLKDAFTSDLSGGLKNDAILALDGKLTTVEDYFQLAQKRYGYDRGEGSNWLGNFLSGVNTQGENLDRTWHRIEAAYQAIPVAQRTQPIENQLAFRRVVLSIDQDLEAYRGFRAAAADLAANAAGAVAGVAVVVFSGGVATPLVVAVAAGAGGAAQALTRMGVAGTFTWEELPADFVLGAVNGATAALSFPAVTRLAITNGTARVGVLRQVAGSAFVGGAVSSGLGTAFNENTWQEGFSVGLANLALSAGVGGFTGTALATVPGAAITFARSTGLSALTRRIVTTTGTELVQLFSATFHGAVRQALAAGSSFAEEMTLRLANFSQRLDDISLRLFNTTASDTTASIRQAIRNLVGSDDWPPFGFEGVADVGAGLWIEGRGELATLGQQGIRDRLLNGLDMLFMSMSEAVERLRARLGQGATTDVAEQVAQRLANQSNVTDEVIRSELQAAGLSTTDDLVRATRQWIDEGQPIAIEAGLSRTRVIKEKLKVGKHRTAAYAEVNVEGLPNEVVGFSGEELRGGHEVTWQNENPGSIVAPPTALPVGPGYQDAEVKILDRLRELLQQNPNACGIVRLFVDQPKGKGVCANCTEAIMTFRRDFADRITLVISAN